MMPQHVEAGPFILPARVAADPALSGTAKVVFAIVASTRGLNGLCTEPIAAICRAAGASDRAVRDALRQLVDAGYLARLHDPHRPSAWAILPVGRNCRLQSADFADQSAENADSLTTIQSADIADTPPLKPEEIWPDLPDQSAENADSRARARTHALPPPMEEENYSPLVKEERKGGAGGKPRRIPQPCPEDFTPSPRTLALLQRKRPNVDLSYELAKFVRYWTEGRGAGTRRLDWDASFLRWVEKADASPSPSPAAAAPGGARAAAPVERLTPSGQRLLKIAMGED